MKTTFHINRVGSMRNISLHLADLFENLFVQSLFFQIHGSSNELLSSLFGDGGGFDAPLCLFINWQQTHLHSLKSLQFLQLFESSLFFVFLIFVIHFILVNDLFNEFLVIFYFIDVSHSLLFHLGIECLFDVIVSLSSCYFLRIVISFGFQVLFVGVLQNSPLQFLLLKRLLYQLLTAINRMMISLSSVMLANH